MPPHLQAALDNNQEEEQKRKENKPQEEQPADARDEGREEQNQGLQEQEGEEVTAAGQVDPPPADEQVQENPAGDAVEDQQLCDYYSCRESVRAENREKASVQEDFRQKAAERLLNQVRIRQSNELDIRIELISNYFLG